MKILLDTQVLIWLINGDTRIGLASNGLLSDRSNEVYLSYFSLFEMKIKASIGKLKYDDSLVADLPKMGIELLMPTTKALAMYDVYASDNKDPFDNILIASAKSDKCLFVTSDVKILRAPLRGLRLQDARE